VIAYFSSHVRVRESAGRVHFTRLQPLTEEVYEQARNRERNPRHQPRGTAREVATTKNFSTTGAMGDDDRW
jgi:hypothetical protein